MFKPYTLPYKYGALEPYIDEKTMEVHYSKHYLGYLNKLNTALENYPNWQTKKIEELLASLDELPQEIRTAVKNNGGGYYNHTLFWQILSPKQTYLHGLLKKAIEQSFGSPDSFKEKFTQQALTLFGSGWVWLVVDKDNIEIISTPNQDSPISIGKTPILTLDVWEHAYYLKYQNRRDEYIASWWNVINWNAVGEKFNDNK